MSLLVRRRYLDERTPSWSRRSGPIVTMPDDPDRQARPLVPVVGPVHTNPVVEPVTSTAPAPSPDPSHEVRQDQSPTRRTNLCDVIVDLTGSREKTANCILILCATGVPALPGGAMVESCG